MDCNPQKIEALFDRLWPIHRSLAGPGFRESLDVLSETVPFDRLRFATGKQVFDWTVPPEWHVHEAYVVGPDGKRRWDVKDNNLHLLGYSAPFRGTVSRSELDDHLHSLPGQPDAIPYMTSYYEARWGFCVPHAEREALPEGDYEVVVDTELEHGFLEVGEAVLTGETDEEILFSSYLCHPSMANNELSGPLVLAFLYERLAGRARRRYTYRFVLGPETIGAIAYLSVRGQHFKEHLKAGYVLTCIGDRGEFTYKQSRNGRTLADQAAHLILRDQGPHETLCFFPNGSDERQYCSPGFDLPVGSLARTLYRPWPEYHTSLDNKDYISFEKMAESIEVCAAITDALECNTLWRSACMDCEPFLSKYGVYPTLHSLKSVEQAKMAILWLQNLADGTNDLFAIAERSGLPVQLLAGTAQKLESVGLLVAGGTSTGVIAEEHA